MFVEYVPTFYVPVSCVGATLDEECRSLVRGRGKFVMFLKKYRFFFDIRVSDTGIVDVKLRDDVSHPKRGTADAKFMMTDVGENRTFTVRPEFIQNMESIEISSENVMVRPPQAPPSIHVEMEERVPVVDRLKSLVPAQFTLIEEVEEKVPEDVLFHPYFDCQGGLSAIATKFPDLFQVVDGYIRQRPPHIAPLATNDHTLESSPLPSVAERVKELVCSPTVPQWVSLTTIYEQLTADEKKAMKKEFKSFAGFLRAHGKSVAISQDTLKVSKWIAPVAKKAPASSTAKGYTQTHIINELFEKFPRFKSLNLHQTLELIPPEMRQYVPSKVVSWLAAQKSYFVVENPLESNASLVVIRRATDTVPLDIAQSLYPHIPDDGISQLRLIEVLPETTKELVQRLGLVNIAQALSQWLEIVDGDVFRKKTEAELENAIQSEESKQRLLEESESDVMNVKAQEESERRLMSRFPTKFEGMRTPRSS